MKGQKMSDMAKVLNMKGEPQIEICGIPYENYLKMINELKK